MKGPRTMPTTWFLSGDMCVDCINASLELKIFRFCYSTFSFSLNINFINWLSKRGLSALLEKKLKGNYVSLNSVLFLAIYCG